MTGIETTNPTIERAIEIVSDELEVVEAEQRAFETFLSRVRDVEPRRTRAPTTGSGGTAPLAVARFRQTSSPSAGPSAAQRQVIDAYRESIMRLDHYDEEYGNGLQEDVAIEFDRQVAAALEPGADLTPALLEHLVSQADDSVTEREQFGRVLERELASLERCDADLGEIEARFYRTPSPHDVAVDVIPEIRRDLAALERDCRELIVRRQETIHSRPNGRFGGADGPPLEAYLYGQHLSVTLPALHDALSLVEDVSAQRERCALLESDEGDVDRRDDGFGEHFDNNVPEGDAATE